MYEDHAFGEWLPDEFYALHVNPDLPVGTISTRVGTLFAATCEVNITLKGKVDMRLFRIKQMIWSWRPQI